MFGAGWQSRMTNAVVLETVEKFLTLPGAPTLVNAEALPSPFHRRNQSLPSRRRDCTPGRLEYASLKGVCRKESCKAFSWICGSNR